VAASSGHWEYQLLYTPVALVAWALIGTEPVERATVWHQARGWLRMGMLARSAS
jgi:hypothetical protein